MFVMRCVFYSIFFYPSEEKSLFALVVHLIDSEFKLREILIFAKPFSEVSHTAWETEKVIKMGLASYGIGKYDLSNTPIIDTVHLCCVVILNNGACTCS